MKDMIGFKVKLLTEPGASILKAVCVCALFAGLPAASRADDKQPLVPPAPAPKGVHHKGSVPEVKSRASDGAGIQEVSKPPEMPGITFPHAKFLYGFENQTKSGRNSGARFEVPESADAVISSYRNLLKNDGWKINEQACNNQTVFAYNGRYHAAVTVKTFKSRKPGCEVYFTYGAGR